MFREIFIVYVFVQITYANRTEVRNSVISNSLLTRIEKENWSDDEACFKDMRRWLRGVQDRKLWATWYMDSNQLPVASLFGSRYHLGSFEQCLHPRWRSKLDFRMQYCLVDVTSEERSLYKEDVDPFMDVEDFVGIQTLRDRRLYMNSFAVCLPTSCKPESIVKVAKHMREISHLPFGNISLEQTNCQRIEDKNEYSIGFYVFMFIIVSMSIFVTIVHLIEDHITDPKVSKYLQWFSLRKNFRCLSAVNDNEILTLNGIRAISSGVAIVCHYCFFVQSLALFNENYAEKVFYKGAEYLLNLELIIDTFIAISGALIFNKIYHTKESGFTILRDRYLRFIAPYAISLLFTISVLPHAISGPLKPKFINNEHSYCVDNWWLGLLMVGNLFNTDRICYVTSWYIACDFQLAVIGLILMYIWKKNFKNRQAMFFIALAISIIAPGILIYVYRLKPMLIYNHDEAYDVSTNLMLQTLYTKPYYRLNSYLMGFAFGYILSNYKPNNYRKILSKNISLVSFLSGMMLMVIGMKMGGRLELEDFDALKSAFYGTVDRPLFVFGVFLIIFACEYGDLPLISKYLSCQPLMFLNKLSYGAYMYHLGIMYKTTYNIKTAATFSLTSMIIDGSGYIIFSFLTSFALWFIIEAPVNNFVNERRSKKQKVDINSNSNYQKSLQETILKPKIK